MGAFRRRLDSKSGRIIYKTVEVNDDEIVIVGGNKWARLTTCLSGEFKGESYFYHYGQRYVLSEFDKVKNGWAHSEWLNEFDGILHNSSWHGVLIKLGEYGEDVKAFTFYVR